MLMSLVFPGPFSGALSIRPEEYFDHAEDSDEEPATPTSIYKAFSWTLRVQEPCHQDLDIKKKVAKAVTLHVFKKNGDGACA